MRAHMPPSAARTCPDFVSVPTPTHPHRRLTETSKQRRRSELVSGTNYQPCELMGDSTRVDVANNAEQLRNE